MNEIGIVRKIDNLGRIVIPKEMRDRYKLDDDVEIVATENGVLIKNKNYVLIKVEELKK